MQDQRRRHRGKMMDIEVDGETETQQQWNTCLHDERDAGGHIVAS